MGIPNLLKDLRSSFQDVDITYLKGKTVGVDVSIWIYQGGTQYVFRMVDHLRRNGVKCVLVFDGEDLEAKKQILENRKKKRNKKLNAARKLEKAGKLKEAAKLKAKCYKKNNHTNTLIQEWCRTRGVTYYQSPYEADAQLAYLSKKKEIDVVISEDSDLIVYGCEKILFKFDGLEGELYDRQKLQKTWVDPFKPTCLRAVCILVGCDYFKGGLYSFGPKKAQDLYKEMSEPLDFEEMIELLGEDVDEDEFMVAFNTYDFQLVIEPVTGDIVPLTPYPDGKSDDDFPYAGSLEHSKLVGKAHVFVPETTLPPLDLNGRPLYAKTYQCSRCPEKLFASGRALRNHRKNDHPVKCDVCDKVYKNRGSLRDHRKTHEDNPSLDYKCLECGREFLKYSHLEYHRLVHRGKRRECHLCQKRFLLSVQLKLHMRRHHTGEKPYVCVICSHRFASSSDLRNHQAVHTKEKLFSCRYCGKMFGHASVRRTHEATHDPNSKRYPCATCGKEFSQAGNLRNHEKIHQTDRPKFPCPICGKFFASKDTLTYHESTQHTDKQRFSCATCGKEFKQKGHLRRHETTHQSDRPRFQCSTCGESFLGEYYLRLHEASHDPAKQRFKCITCGKGFLTEAQLRSHETSHSNERKFICTFCGKSYKEPSGLRKHKKVCPAGKNQEDSG